MTPRRHRVGSYGHGESTAVSPANPGPNTWHRHHYRQLSRQPRLTGTATRAMLRTTPPIRHGRPAKRAITPGLVSVARSPPQHPPGAHSASVHRTHTDQDSRAARPLPTADETAAGEHRQGGRTRPPDRARDVTNSLVPDHPATEVPDRPAGAVTEARHRARPRAPGPRPSAARASCPRRPQAPRTRHRPRRRVHRTLRQQCRNILRDTGRGEPGSERASFRQTPVRTQDRSPEVAPSPCQRSAAGRATGQPAPPVADERARGANQAGTTPRQQWLGASEQPPRDGPQARQRRAPHRRQAAADRAPRRGRRQGEREGRPRPPERALAAIRTRAPARASRRQPRRSSRLCRANEGCSERSERNPKCVTTPYALFD